MSSVDGERPNASATHAAADESEMMSDMPPALPHAAADGENTHVSADKSEMMSDMPPVLPHAAAAADGENAHVPADESEMMPPALPREYACIFA